MGLFWIWDCLIRHNIAHLGNVADMGNWSGLLIEKANEYQLNLCVGYIDYEKAFDSVEHADLLIALRKNRSERNICENYRGHIHKCSSHNSSGQGCFKTNLHQQRCKTRGYNFTKNIHHCHGGGDFQEARFWGARNEYRWWMVNRPEVCRWCCSNNTIS